MDPMELQAAIAKALAQQQGRPDDYDVTPSERLVATPQKVSASMGPVSLVSRDPGVISAADGDSDDMPGIQLMYDPQADDYVQQLPQGFMHIPLADAQRMLTQKSRDYTLGPVWDGGGQEPELGMDLRQLMAKR